jgi:hypothetical protein
MSDDFCGGCFLVVAPHAPDRILVGKFVFHRSCLVRFQAARRQLPATSTPPPTRKRHRPFFHARR